MDKIEALAKELKELVEDTELVKEYRRVEALYKSNAELLQLASNIEKAEKDGNEELRQKLVKKFNSNPLASNYQSLKQEVFNYLKEITDIINN